MAELVRRPSPLGQEAAAQVFVAQTTRTPPDRADAALVTEPECGRCTWAA